MTTRTKTPKKTEKDDTLEADASLQALVQVREILFGEQVRQHDQKRADLEQQLVDTITTLRGDCDRRFAEVGTRLDTLMGALQEESEARQQENSALNNRLDDIDATLERQNTANKAAHVDILDQMDSLSIQMSQKLEKVESELNRSIQANVEKLTADKADRTSLASLLSGIASQLSDSNPAAPDQA
ncbi:hypothetical protein [Teredinibacter haidensis]|uniref:hypothetical protein n=1 Tax=Teredinibacter haidensis TaxID=2731755 RepID=UPI0009491183|nr:hypothetical protein [Teredinibacter haidensis]